MTPDLNDEQDLETAEYRRGEMRKSSRASTRSARSIVNLTQEDLHLWSQLPEEIRADPCFLVFRQEHDSKCRENLATDCNNNNDASGDDNNNCRVRNRSAAAALQQHQSEPEHPDSIEMSYDDESSIGPKASGSSLRRQVGRVARLLKMGLLVGCWILTLVALAMKKEKIETSREILLASNGHVKNLTLAEAGGIVRSNRGLSVEIGGSWLLGRADDAAANYDDNNKSVNDSSADYNYLTIWLELLTELENSTYADVLDYADDKRLAKNISKVWTLPVLSPAGDSLDALPRWRERNVFDLEHDDRLENTSVLLNIKSNLNSSIPITVTYDFSPINLRDGIMFGAIILVGLYVLIIFEVIHRTISAVLASTCALAVLALLNQRPTMEEIVSWIDMDTLMLLFSMMILVAIVAETGIFDYLAVYAYKLSGGKVWPLITTLCFFTAFVASVLDNVTTILMTTPVTIRLCEVMHLNPVPILIMKVIFSNIGGAMTPIGDPPNIIIASNRDVINAGVDFGSFTAHMGVGVILCLAVAYAQFRFLYRNIDALRTDEPVNIKKIKQKMVKWQKAAANIPDDSLVKDKMMNVINDSQQQLEAKLKSATNLTDQYKKNLVELQEKYRIRNKALLAKSSFCLVLLMSLFFMHSVPNFNLTMGWTAFLCVLLLLIVTDSEDLDHLMTHVEWNTLIFFAALFVLMEALTKLGLISWIGKNTELLITSVDKESRLAVAIVLLLWVSAVFSALVDNVPLTTMMIKIATDMSKNENLDLPLQPLVWALAFGACLGGNGTLIGASANIVCAGIAEQHGYRFTFVQFFKTGFPILLTTTATITGYLMVAHVLFNWN